MRQLSLFTKQNKDIKMETNLNWSVILKRQSGHRCMICSNHMKIECKDHNHETGEFRAFLCKECNSSLSSATIYNSRQLAYLTTFGIYGPEKSIYYFTLDNLMMCCDIPKWYKSEPLLPIVYTAHHFEQLIKDNSMWNVKQLEEVYELNNTNRES